MSEPVTIILTPVGIITTGVENNKSFFQIIGKDTSNNTFIMTFACPSYLEEAVVKYLRKLQPVDVTPEPVPEVKPELPAEEVVT